MTSTIWVIRTWPPRKSVWDRVDLGHLDRVNRNGHPVILSTALGALLVVLMAENGLCPVQATHRLCDNIGHRMHLPAAPSVPAALPRALRDAEDVEEAL